MNAYFKDRGISDFLTNIQNGVDRSSEIIRNMLNFSSNSASHREVCSIRRVIEDSVKLVRSGYDQKKKKDFKQIRIDLNLPEDLPSISINRIEIQQVIFNLLKMQPRPCLILILKATNRRSRLRQPPMTRR